MLLCRQEERFGTSASVSKSLSYSLASIAATASASSTPPPAVLPRKIMRRGEDGELAPASAAPSKPTSEAGSDGKDKTSQARPTLKVASWQVKHTARPTHN